MGVQGLGFGRRCIGCGKTWKDNPAAAVGCTLITGATCLGHVPAQCGNALLLLTMLLYDVSFASKSLRAAAWR